MSTFSFTASEKTIQSIYDYFDGQYTTNPKNPYIRYLFYGQQATITVYSSNKVVISGKNAHQYQALFDTNIKPSLILPQAGSDEVGTGDFFGPICVCGCIVDETIYPQIQSLKLDDSKKLTDEYILSIAPKLMKIVPHSLLVLSNSKYNQVIQTNNMNQIKAKMHNQCYLNLKKKGYSLPEFIVIDQFCSENLYDRYLKGIPKVSPIHFETKAESKYLSVAISSMIARFAFLKEMEALDQQYHCHFPKGASAAVDQFAQWFVDQYGYQQIYQTAKMNFKNKDKIKSM